MENKLRESASEETDHMINDREKKPHSCQSTEIQANAAKITERAGSSLPGSCFISTPAFASTPSLTACLGSASYSSIPVASIASIVAKTGREVASSITTCRSRLRISVITWWTGSIDLCQ
jgi:hypothetical protein